MSDITADEASRLARARVASIEADSGIDLTLLESETVVLDIGWVYFWGPTAHLVSGHARDAVAGGGPIFVDRRDGSTHMVWSGEDWTTAIEQHRREGHMDPLWLTQRRVSRDRFLKSPAQWPAGFLGFEARGPDMKPEVIEALAQSLDDELQREVGRGHRLRGLSAVAIAKRSASDDVLFALSDSDAVVVVHLSWTGRRDKAPWPSCLFFSSFEAFLADASDHFES